MKRVLRVAGLLAFTSVRRSNPGVVVLTMLILVLVTLNLLFVPGLLDALVQGANDKLVNTYSGDLLIESGVASPYVEEVDRLVLAVESISGVSAATPRSTLAGQIEFGNHRVNSVVYGVRPDTESSVFTIGDYLVEGSLLAADDTDVMVLGIQLAGADKANLEFYSRSLQQVHAGDVVTVTYANGVRKPYTVKGIFHTEFIQTDLQAFVSETELRTIEPTLTDRASTVHIKTVEGVDTAAISREIADVANDVRVLTWQSYAGIVNSMTESFSIIDVILNTVNLLVAGVTVFIVTYIDVAGRRRQIGIQRAIGIVPASIMLSYVLRALFYSAIALIAAGLLFAYVVVPVEASYPFHFPFGDVKLRVVPTFLARSAAMMLAVSIVAAVVPVRGVIRTRIIDAIWG